MKVLLLAPTPPPYGGIAGWTERMKNASLEHNWEVTVVDEKLIGNRNVFGNKSSLNFFVEMKRCFKIWYNLFHALNDKEIRVVQACIPARLTSMLREIICVKITKKKKRKFIVHFRCTLSNIKNNRLTIYVLKELIRLSDYVFVLNRASADFLKGMDCKTPYEVIPNFIEDSKINEKAYINESLNTLLYVGGVTPEKGCNLIVEVANKFPEKNFILVGKFGMNLHEIPKNVIFTGEKKKKDVEKYMKESDAFLFLSRYPMEGFSNALAEAMANSLPCIVSDWAANKDMIEDGGGIVLNECSVDNLVNAINIMNSSKRRIKCGEWNRRKVLNNYTEKIVTSMYVNAYERIIK